MYPWLRNAEQKARAESYKRFLMPMYPNVTCTYAEFEEGRGSNFQSAEMPRDAKVVSTMAPAAFFVRPERDGMIHTGSARLCRCL